MKEFSSKDVMDAVCSFVVQNCVVLKEDLVLRVVAAAQVAWNSIAPVSIRTQHEFVFYDDPKAGQYRETALINQGGQARDYPRSSMVGQLMVRVFVPSYARATSKVVACAEELYEDLAWQIGAMLRSIHPFYKGNLVLSWIIENQLRLIHGLSLTTKLRPKVEFDEFRKGTFFPLVEKTIY